MIFRDDGVIASQIVLGIRMIKFSFGLLLVQGEESVLVESVDDVFVSSRAIFSCSMMVVIACFARSLLALHRVSLAIICISGAFVLLLFGGSLLSVLPPSFRACETSHRWR